MLVNTTNSDAVITLDQQGNYSCVATSKYGSDKEEFPVIFTGKYGWKYIYISPWDARVSLLFIT